MISSVCASTMCHFTSTQCAGITGESFLSVAGKSGRILKGSFVDGFVTDRYSRLVLNIGAIAISLVIGLIMWAVTDDIYKLDTINNSTYCHLSELCPLPGRTHTPAMSCHL